MNDRRVAVLAIAGAIAAAACQSATPSATRGSGSGGPWAATPTIEAPTFGPPPSPTPPDETSPLILDPTVLQFLPATVNGISVTESINEATQGLTNPALPNVATAMDAGVAVDAGNGNLVYAWVVRLRADKFSDVFYRQWRDSYDDGACSAAGGVLRNAEATIDNRTVYIATCAQGLRTYHVWLKDQAILISASAVGTGNFGEVLMDNLRVPA